MNHLKTTFILTCCMVCTASWAVQPEAGYVANRHPLIETSYMEIPLGNIKAEGWLNEQLQRQRTGLTGHLDEIYPQVVGKRNAWLGGDGDAWERGPYWIDGLLPLAYLLDDNELKAKAQIWVEAILNSQKADGYFGPDTDRPHEPGLQRNNSHDWWPKMVALKIIKQYYMATRDERVIPFLTKYFKYQLQMLPTHPLDHWTFWGAQRGGDNLDIVYWLYNLTGEPFLLELGKLIHSQTTPWTEYFTTTDHLYRQNSLHCVNLGQGFKEPVIYYQQSKDARNLHAVEEGMRRIRNSFGLPTGLWAGDESLHFGHPNRGSEFCTAVEMMYSLECITRITGSTDWADHLERVAYNALPTQADDNFTGRQYYQQTNQIECSLASRNFSTPHATTDQVFGELNGYPCCTTNMHQGWPKFVQNLWYATTDEGVAALLYGPSSLKATVANGTKVEIKEDTNYPFDETIAFTINFTDKKQRQAYFPFHLRIPAWCKDAQIKVNGQPLALETHPGTVCIVRRNWTKGDVLTLELPMQVTSGRWYDNAAVVERGPLLYALRMDETWTKKEMPADMQDTYGKWYYEVTSDTPWNFALIEEHLKADAIGQHITVEKATVMASYPWNVENAPIVLHAKALPLPGWKAYNGSAGDVTFSTLQAQDNTTTDITLIPYGCTTLRITEFPVRRGIKQ
ncbi:MAG: glycoside hydrolase family 127 protein [Bacteroidales bacterium]|nr:glycoside hydrolase family 127 protein [Bacteroidales bacterium]